MNLFSTQDKALENYFDALLFADDGSDFDDAADVSPLLSHDVELDVDAYSRPDSLNISEIRPYTNDVSRVAVAPATVTDVVINDEDVMESRDSVESQDAIAVITRSMTEDKFLFIQPVAVVGLKLALPMDRVSEVRAYTDERLEFIADDKMVLGTLRYQGCIVPVLNTAAIVVPDDHPRHEAMMARKNYQHILILDQGRLALAVDSIDEQVFLPTDNIRWNNTSTHYTWLAGTLIDYGYAVINAERLKDYLD